MKFSAFIIFLTMVFYPSQLLEVLIGAGIIALWDIQKLIEKKEHK